MILNASVKLDIHASLLITISEITNARLNTYCYKNVVNNNKKIPPIISVSFLI